MELTEEPRYSQAHNLEHVGKFDNQHTLGSQMTSFLEESCQETQNNEEKKEPMSNKTIHLDFSRVFKCKRTF